MPSIPCRLLLLLMVPLAHAEPWSQRYVLLGEVHDNADGHRLRLQLLDEQLQQGWRPALVLEQFDSEQQQALQAAQQQCGADDACVARQAGGAAWQWSFYLPLLQRARHYQLPLYAGNLSRQHAGRVVREGYGVLSPPLAATLAAVPADIDAGQQQATRSGHCDLLPAALLPGMARAQIARDAHMAGVMQAAASAGRPVLLIAGNGHVRRDIGVPRWLPQGQSLSIAFSEQDEGERFDRQIRVPVASRPDPCRELGGG